jgi:hypothetical protein
VGLAVAFREPATASVMSATAMGATATVRSTASVMASVISDVGLTVALGESATVSAWHLRFVGLVVFGLFQLVHPSRCLLHLASFH